MLQSLRHGRAGLVGLRRMVDLDLVRPRPVLQPQQRRACRRRSEARAVARGELPGLRIGQRIVGDHAAAQRIGDQVGLAAGFGRPAPRRSSPAGRSCPAAPSSCRARGPAAGRATGRSAGDTGMAFSCCAGIDREVRLRRLAEVGAEAPPPSGRCRSCRRPRAGSGRPARSRSSVLPSMWRTKASKLPCCSASPISSTKRAVGPRR